jgi:hypothetical protein
MRHVGGRTATHFGGLRDHLEDPSIDGTLMFKHIVKKWDGKMWTGLIWQRIKRVGSCTVFHKILGASSLAEELSASQGLCHLQLASQSVFLSLSQSVSQSAALTVATSVTILTLNFTAPSVRSS